MADAFISYQREPSTMAARFVQERLKNKHSIHAYLDAENSDNIQGQFEEKLMQEIADAPVFILMLADTTLESEWVRKEIQRAYELQKHCIPVFQESYKQKSNPDSAIKYVLGFQGVKLYDKQNDYIPNAIDDIANRVKKQLEAQSPQLTNITQKSQIAIPPKPKIILPQPFDWCYIPAGKVTLTPDAIDNNIYIKSNTVVDVSAFWMAKYPITNAQFKMFIQNGGYKNDVFWTEQGLKHLNSKEWNYPQLFKYDNWNGDLQPVVGVSWYEAIAFCNWLSNEIGNHISLPSDKQWQYAVQGREGRLYSWGNEWKSHLCNHNVDNPGAGYTTPVNRYEKMYEPMNGLIDMTGNVFEWCLTQYQTGNDELNGRTFITRGGSYYHKDKKHFSTYFRWNNLPSDRYSFIGFRIACQIDPR
ncbi:MAG: SUMF1/EgtB/PvdO family nonheme iron enzyme [Anaerolineae bacterium]|nr:SUMF1/EgtB/PvdO family nonheme iron enzyme [Anaerolineae bacterium]